MSMKNFLKRFVAAYGKAACEELDKTTAPLAPPDLSNATAEQIDSLEANPLNHDYNTLPAGFSDAVGLEDDL